MKKLFLGLVFLITLLIVLGSCATTKTQMPIEQNQQTSNQTTIDGETKRNIAQALWLREYDEDQIPKGFFEKIKSAKNSNKSIGSRNRYHLQELLESPLSFLPSSTKRYKTLIEHSASLSAQQAYAMTLFQGLNSVMGYLPIPRDPDLKFPEYDAPQLKNQVGWHFFVGNCIGTNDKHYSIEMMFWRYSLLPPEMAANFGLTDIENQVIEMHLAISDASAGVHYRANTVVVAGTTGLINFTANPFSYALGNNRMQSLSKNNETFPIRLQAWGLDEGKEPVAEIEIDLFLDNIKGYFMEGDEGCAPCVDGVGTLYYSASNLQLSTDSESKISINGQEIMLKQGKMWYDHQWGTGFMPSGCPQHAVLRAVQNLSRPAPGGWDWFMIQFDNNVELTLAALHTIENEKFYGRTGDDPPDVMTAEVKGKYIDENSVAHDIKGELKVAEWVKSVTTPNPRIYWITNIWYPNRFEFVLTEGVPDPIRSFTLTPIVPSGQTGFFGTGLQYSEGGAVAMDGEGKEIGRGFAESTGYIISTKNVMAVAGIPQTKRMIRILERKKTSPCLWINSLFYFTFNGRKFKKIMAEASGF